MFYRWKMYLVLRKRKRADIGILVREAGGRCLLLLSVGAASVHGTKEISSLVSFCAVWEIITSQRLEHSMKFAKHRVHYDIEDRGFYSG